MIWVNLLQLLLSVAGQLAKYVGDKQLIDAGKAYALSDNLLIQNTKIKNALQAAKNTTLDADGDGVPDPDEHQRH